MSTWIKVSNSMPANPKLLQAGDRAGWLFICGLCYANEHLTDGFIPRATLPVVAPGVRGSEKVATQLVKVGLWHEVDGGWQIHDYAGYQRSADEIKAKRKAAADRQEKWRLSHIGDTGVAA